MAAINRSKLADLIIDECSFGDKNAQRKAGGKMSTQELLAVYLVLKGVIEFDGKDKTIRFNETLETAERLASGRIEDKTSCIQTGCRYRNPVCESGGARYGEGLCGLVSKNSNC